MASTNATLPHNDLFSPTINHIPIPHTFSRPQFWVPNLSTLNHNHIPPHSASATHIRPQSTTTTTTTTLFSHPYSSTINHNHFPPHFFSVSHIPSQLSTFFFSHPYPWPSKGFVGGPERPIPPLQIVGARASGGREGP